MSLQISRVRRGRAKAPGLSTMLLAAGLGLAMPTTAGAAPLSELFGFGQPGGADTRVAQSQQQQLAQLLVQLQQMQEQVRTLTGQVDGLEFQVSQMQAELQKQQADNEERFRQLEGGGPARAGAAQGRAGDGTDAAGPGDLASAAGGGAPPDRLGPSQDPLVGSGARDGATAPLAPVPAVRPGEVGPGPDQLPPQVARADAGDTSATARYDAAYQSLAAGNYSLAEQQFRQFLELYPQDAHAADATNWLGEALLQERRYDDAAQVLVDGFKKYRDTSRGADILLRLGIALAGADEVQAACKTFAEAKRRYPDTSPAFKKRLDQEVARTRCAA